MIKKLIALFFLVSVLNSSYAEDSILKIHYQSRPPLYIIDPKTRKLVGGEVYKVANKVLLESKIPFKYEESPLMRSIKEMEKNKQPICYLAVYKNSDREKLFNFSLPYFKEKKILLVTRINDERFNEYKKLTDILKNNKLIPILKIGISYGEYIDQKLKELKRYSHLTPQKINREIKVTSYERNEFFEMILTNEADYTFSIDIEFDYFTKLIPKFKNSLTAKELQDIPDGNLRYFMCSKSVDQSTIDKINNTIKKIIHLK